MEDVAVPWLRVDEDGVLLVIPTRRGDDYKQRKKGKRMEAAAWCLAWRNGDEVWMDSVVAGGMWSRLDPSPYCELKNERGIRACAGTWG